MAYPSGIVYGTRACRSPPRTKMGQHFIQHGSISNHLIALLPSTGNSTSGATSLSSSQNGQWPIHITPSISSVQRVYLQSHILTFLVLSHPQWSLPQRKRSVPAFVPATKRASLIAPSSATCLSILIASLYGFNHIGTEVEGIFRINGSAKRMRELQTIFETPPRYGKNIQWQEHAFTPHDVASIFRRFLTFMPVSYQPLV